MPFPVAVWWPQSWISSQEREIRSACYWKLKLHRPAENIWFPHGWCPKPCLLDSPPMSKSCNFQSVYLKNRRLPYLWPQNYILNDQYYDFFPNLNGFLTLLPGRFIRPSKINRLVCQVAQYSCDRLFQLLCDRSKFGDRNPENLISRRFAPVIQIPENEIQRPTVSVFVNL